MLRPRSAATALVLIKGLPTCWANNCPASPARRTHSHAVDKL